MWTTLWATLTLTTLALALTNTPNAFNALLLFVAATLAMIFGFSLSLSIARRRHEATRDPSQPLAKEDGWSDLLTPREPGSERGSEWRGERAREQLSKEPHHSA